MVALDAMGVRWIQTVKMESIFLGVNCKVYMKSCDRIYYKLFDTPLFKDESAKTMKFQGLIQVQVGVKSQSRWLNHELEAADPTTRANPWEVKRSNE